MHLLILGNHLILVRHILTGIHMMNISYLLVLIYKLILCIIDRPCRPLLIPKIHLLVDRHILVLVYRFLWAVSTLLEFLSVYSPYWSIYPIFLLILDFLLGVPMNFPRYYGFNITIIMLLFSCLFLLIFVKKINMVTTF